jgi:hypothetical protein
MKQILMAHEAGLQMVDLHNGDAIVDSVQLYRHAGDHDAGNEDSWFVIANVKVEGHEGGRAIIGMTHRSHLQHGETKDKACALAMRVLRAGSIKLKLWKDNLGDQD